MALPKLRVAFECKERWDDMVGDDRIRHCGRCRKDVFDLSAMTRAEAEVVLASVAPCIRFYQRADGTVMTSDCAPPPRRHLSIASGVAVSMLAPAAFADPESVTTPLPEPRDQLRGGAVPFVTSPLDDHFVMGGFTISQTVTDTPPMVEWSLWGRLGAGVEMRHPDVLARGLTMPAMQSDAIWEAALDGEVTLGVARDRTVRIGAYGEIRTTTNAAVGGELMLEGQRVFVVRLGGGAQVFTAGLGLGFVGDYPRWGHHVFGARDGDVRSLDRGSA